ncbi:asparagine synthase (glutamine-hydrolyzing) [Streptomyces sp. NPDC001933]|uniref:asparagine synthase (glutamine-hydrolyzing) n=1 Tax=Streptomyces sp. NPDC001933 TaxID=3364626 RepID=UPI00367407F8
MSGITGWVDFTRDLTAEDGTVRRMTQSLTHRGPDGSGHWTTGHAALGRTRLAAADPGGSGEVTVVAEDGAELVAAVCTGTVFNAGDLRAELRGRGHRLRTEGAAELLARAYLEWGESFVDRLVGMYAIALWDLRTEELLLVRDRMGVEPLYYHRGASFLVFGSEPKAVFEHGQLERRLTADGLREIISSGKTPGHAIMDGLHELRPGHLLRTGRDGVRTCRYWQLTAAEHGDDLDTTVRTVRELLADAVGEQLVADGPVCSLLSGGLDSSTLTALASSWSAEQGRGPFSTFSVDFVGYADHFRASHMRATPDGPFIRDVVDHCGTEHATLVLDSSSLTDADARAGVLRAMDLPMGMGDLSTSGYLLFRAVREHSAVVLSGESADELFGGYSWFQDPAVVEADTFPWLARHFEDDASGAGLMDPALYAELDITGYHARRYEEALSEVPVLAGESRPERRMREITYLNLTRFSQILLDRRDRMSMAAGLQVRVPFCDHRLIEYVYNVPWKFKSFDGHEKSLLRAAARDLLPGTVLGRRKSHFPRTQDPAYDASVIAEFGKIAGRPDAPLTALLNPAAVAELGAGGPDSLAGGRIVLEGLVEINNWLETYDVALDV